MRFLALLLALFLVTVGPSRSYSQQTSTQSTADDTSITRFESEIVEFENADKADPPKAGGVVFVGSSSIRMWPQLQADFPGINVIQRGFGGAQMNEVLYYTPRIVTRYKPKLVVLYAGENDLVTGRHPDQIFNDYKAFVALVHKTVPDAKIAYVSIKPSGDRWVLVDNMKKANALIKKYIAGQRDQTYVDVFTPMIGPDGLPRDELFGEDKLHMNWKGYELWRVLLTPIVTASVAQAGPDSH